MSTIVAEVSPEAERGDGAVPCASFTIAVPEGGARGGDAVTGAAARVGVDASASVDAGAGAGVGVDVGARAAVDAAGTGEDIDPTVS